MKKNFQFILFIFTAFCVLNICGVDKVFSQGEEDLFEKFGVTEPREEKPVPEFTLKRLNGKEININNYRGKLVLLNFWATWCAPCRKEMPDMQKVYEQYKEKGFVIVAVAIDRGDKKIVQSFVDEFKLTFPLLLDKDQKVRKEFFVRALPTSYLINREGKIIGFAAGSMEWNSEDAIKLIKSLL